MLFTIPCVLDMLVEIDPELALTYTDDEEAINLLVIAFDRIAEEHDLG